MTIETISYESSKDGIEDSLSNTSIPSSLSMSSSQLKACKVLLLCCYIPSTANTIMDHIRSFRKFSKNEITIVNMMGPIPPDINLEDYDAIIIHYSICISVGYLNKEARLRIRLFEGHKTVYIQDDYRWINRTVASLAYMKIDAIFGLASKTAADQIYTETDLPTYFRKETVLAGYVPENLLNLEPKPFDERTIDVGYRARKVPYWIGKHCLQKWQIVDRFLEDNKQFNLICDLSYHEEDRIYGENWIQFIANCKAMLGTESGSSVVDFTGDIQEKVEKYVELYPDATFDEVSELYLKDIDGKIMMNVISPRCFEAATLHTLMIYYEGHYSGILIPWRHYVPLAHDHSNIGQVVAVLKDQGRRDEIVKCAYQEIALNEQYTYKAMVLHYDNLLTEEMATNRLKDRALPLMRAPLQLNEESVDALDDEPTEVAVAEYKPEEPDVLDEQPSYYEESVNETRQQIITFLRNTHLLPLAKFVYAQIQNIRSFLYNIKRNIKNSCKLFLSKKAKRELVRYHWRIRTHALYTKLSRHNKKILAFYNFVITKAENIRTFDQVPLLLELHKLGLLYEELEKFKEKLNIYVDYANSQLILSDYIPKAMHSTLEPLNSDRDTVVDCLQGKKLTSFIVRKYDQYDLHYDFIDGDSLSMNVLLTIISSEPEKMTGYLLDIFLRDPTN